MLQATLPLDDINAELQIAGNSAEPALPREAALHPFQAAKLGKAPFTCVDVTIGEHRCAYCTTQLKYLYHIRSADAREFIVGSECVKQTGGAVAGFEKFNRQMEARVRALQAAARKERKADKVAEEAAAWRAAHPDEHAYMVRRAEAGNSFYRYMLDCVAKYGSVFEHRLTSVRADMARDAAKPVEQRRAPAPAPVVNLAPVEAAFAKAKAAGIKWPKLRLGAFVFSPAGATSANAGAVYIKQRTPAGEEAAVYLGKVLGGKLFKSRDCDAAAEAEILAVAADPKAAAVAYGRKFGRCSVCNRELTDAASVEAGIGPVCAVKYGF